MTAFTRLTVVGSTHRCELVVPSDEALGAVLPRVLDLVREPVGPVTRPLRMVLPTGDQLDVARTPADQRLRDGTVVRLVRAEDAPPPAQVADVTDVLGDDLASRTDLWTARARTVTGSVALAAAGAAGAGLLTATTQQRLVAIAAVLLLAAGAGRLPGPGRTVACGLTGLALGAAAVAALRLGLAPNVTATGWVLPVATAAGLLGWTGLAVGIGVGLGDRSVLAGSVLGLAAVGVPLLASSTGPVRAAAFGAITAVVACGLLPRYAAAAAGLTALDTALLAGRPQLRRVVRGTVDRTYAALTWSVFGLCWTIAATAGVLLGSANGWAAGLGVAVVAVTALRTRAFPIAAQQAGLWAAVVLAVLTGAFGRSGLAPPTDLSGLAVFTAVALGLLVVRPPEHARALLRRVGDAAEVVAVLALVPLLLGLFGIYGQLLGAFR